MATQGSKGKGRTRTVLAYENRPSFPKIINSLAEPQRESAMEKLAKDLEDWVFKVIKEVAPNKNRRGVSLTTFRTSKGITYDKWKDWCKKYPVLKESNDLAREIIGEHLFSGSLEGDFHPGTAHFKMGKYDPEWAEIQRENQEDQIQNNKELFKEALGEYLRAFPSTDRVKPLPKESDVSLEVQNGDTEIKEPAPSRKHRDGQFSENI